MQKQENALDRLFDLLEESFIWIFDILCYILNMTIIFLINQTVRLIKWIFKIITNKIKTIKFSKRQIDKQTPIAFDYSMQVIEDIMPYLYSNPSNYNINIESIEKLCNEILEAYQITIDNVKNKTYFIYDGLYFLNKIVCVTDDNSLSTIERLAQKLRNVEGLQPLCKLILSTATKRRMSQNKTYTINQIQGLYTQLDTLHQIVVNDTLTQRNEGKIINTDIKHPLSNSKLFSIISYAFLFIITIIFLIKPW